LIPVNVPRDRDGSFEPQAIPKRSKDITGIDDKVLSMHGRGMSQRDIASTIEDIYGFSLSAESISNITDRVLEEAEVWQNRPLKPFYPYICRLSLRPYTTGLRDEKLCHLCNSRL